MIRSERYITSNKDLSHAEQSLLRKGPSFIPTPTAIKWYNLKCDFDSFVNKLRYRVSKPAETSSINVNHTTNMSNSLVFKSGIRQLKQNFRM